MTALARYQDHFAAALLSGADARGALAYAPAVIARLTAQPGFAVYRNTVFKGCIDALEANFPAVARLVGTEWMRAAAGEYARAEPPRSPRLLDYGATFPGFLATFEPAAGLPWLPDVATLDRLWIEAHVAADAPVLDVAQVAAWQPADLMRARLVPHPATRWSWCAHSPAFTIWSRNRTDDAPAVDVAGADATGADAEIDWAPEGALLTRPEAAVDQCRLSRAGIAFLDACAAGQTVEAAALAALDAEPAADLRALIGALLSAGAFAALTHTPDAHP